MTNRKPSTGRSVNGNTHRSGDTIIERPSGSRVRDRTAALGGAAEHLGQQLAFYLTAVDAQVKASEDAPTIGLLLCKSKNKVVAEYALRDGNKPMGVAEYQLVHAIPAQLETSLPSIEQIEAELTEPPKPPGTARHPSAQRAPAPSKTSKRRGKR
jgi:hypothetical protein